MSHDEKAGKGADITVAERGKADAASFAAVLRREMAGLTVEEKVDKLTEHFASLFIAMKAQTASAAKLKDSIESLIADLKPPRH